VDANACTMAPGQYGKLTQKSYDKLSKRYKVNVVTDTGNSDSGDGNNSGNNSGGNLIAEIIKLLTGQGSGGLGNIETLLGGLSNGQLSDLLKNLQNGGNITTLLAQLFGANLTSPDDSETDSE
jgi:hypothetical protein